MKLHSSIGSQQSRHYSWTFDVEPVAKGRPRFYNGRAVTPKKTKDATKVIADAIRDTEFIPFEKGEPLRVSIRFMCKRPKRLGKGDAVPKTTKPDLDNYIKLYLDAANDAGVWHDDAQVVEILAQKVYAPDYREPNVTFEVRPL